jgi:radial spoke head protein 4A
LGKEEAYLLQKSLKQLGMSSAAQSLRFFGKITGLQRDYYIVEATNEGEGEADEPAEGEEKDPLQEAKGTGVNKYTYYACNSLFEKWTKLPDLTPTQIKSSRQIRYLLTGDLEALIYSNPFFFGKEKHYLRA